MSRQIVIPFGPQHPVLPEPLHIDLVMEDERVVEAIPSIGYVHRGLEKLVEKRDYKDFVFIAERICGICSFIHGMTYCHGGRGGDGSARAAAGALPQDGLVRASRVCTRTCSGSACSRTRWASSRSSCSPGASASTSSTTWSRRRATA